MSKVSKNTVAQGKSVYDIEYAKEARDAILAAQCKRPFHFLLTHGKVSEVYTVYAPNSYYANLYMVDTFPDYTVVLLQKMEVDNVSQ